MRVVGRDKSTCGKLRLQIQTDLVSTATADKEVGEAGDTEPGQAQWISELTRSGRFVSAAEANGARDRDDERPRRRSGLTRTQSK